jgi:MbtH protein
MTNPFDDEDGEFCVLINDEGQYSLWPTFKDVPAGWNAVGPRDTRQACLAYIEENWTDMRPKRLSAQMERGAVERRGEHGVQ